MYKMTRLLTSTLYVIGKPSSEDNSFKKFRCQRLGVSACEFLVWNGGIPILKDRNKHEASKKWSYLRTVHEKNYFVTVTNICETDNRALFLYRLQPC